MTFVTLTFIKRLCAVVIFSLCLGFSAGVLAKNVTIALISDGEGARQVIPSQRLQEEILELLEPQHSVTFQSLNGGWSEEGVQQVLAAALSNPSIDIIVAQGLVGTHIAGKIPNLNKPVIGMFVPEPGLQGLPLTANKTSGKNNYTYISDLQNFDESLKDILAILPAKKIGLITDEMIVEGVPMLTNQAFYGDANVELITTDGNLESLVEKLPADLGSVMVAPLLRMSRSDIAKLSKVFIERGIPSVSFVGDVTVEDGVLMSVGTDYVEEQKSARRVALNILSVLEGENPADLSVRLEFGGGLQFNQQTAAAIGFKLPWDISLVAKMYDGRSENYTSNNGGLTLNQAVNQALDQNIALAQQRLSFDIAAEDLAIARSSWWPQLNATAQASQLDQGITAIGNPEQSIDAALQVSQVLYSEPLKSGLDIAGLNRRLSRSQLDATILDTIQNVAVAYISVLRAKALEDVQRINLAASLENLALSENRFSLGAVTESDILSWKSQIATDKRNLLSAQASASNAIIGLQNTIQMPFDKVISFDETDTQRLVSLSVSEEVRTTFDNPSDRTLMTQFILQKAIENAPEVEQVEFANAISERSAKAAKRAYYVPTFSFSAQQNANLDRAGRFSAETDAALPEDSWSANIVASYPIFDGRKRKAELSKARYQQHQTKLDGRRVKDAIRVNALNQWNAIGASYPALFLSKEAADAARRSLEMTRDQYSSGAISITTLIQAQNIALAAEIDAAEAQYAFLIDFVNLGRAVADFRAITDENSGNSWLGEFYIFKQLQTNR